jgi:hypothetical protein
MAALSGRSPFHKLSYLRRRFEEVSVSGIKNIYTRGKKKKCFSNDRMFKIQTNNT